MKTTSILLVITIILSVTMVSFAQENATNEAKKLYNEGLGFLKRRQLDPAIEKFNAAVAKDPNLATAYYGLGLAYKFKKNYDKAEKMYKKAIEKNDKMSKFYNALGLLYTQREKYTEALNTYTAALGINPKDAKAHFGLGLVYIKRKDYTNAIAEYKKAVEAKPDYSKAWLNLGTSYYHERKYAEAEEAFNKALQYEKKRTAKGNIYLHLGNTLAKLNRKDEAVGAYENCLKTATKSYLKAAANFGLGEIYRDKGQKQKALKYFRSASRDRSWKQSALYEIDELKRKN